MVISRHHEVDKNGRTFFSKIGVYHETFLLGFAEGYFTVSFIIYIATYLILRNPINTLFYPEIYPVLFGLFYLGYKVNKKQVE